MKYTDEQAYSALCELQIEIGDPEPMPSAAHRVAEALEERLAPVEVTDAMLDTYSIAVESSHDSDITSEGLRRLRRRGLEAVFAFLRGEK